MIDSSRDDEFLGRLKFLNAAIVLVIAILIARVAYLQIYITRIWQTATESESFRRSRRAVLFSTATGSFWLRTALALQFRSCR